MDFYYSFLLLLVVLSFYSESPQHAKAPDSFNSTVVTVCPSSSSTSLGILAPVLPQNEVFEIALPQNGVFEIVLPQNEVFESVLAPSGVFEFVLPQNEVCKIVTPIFNKVKRISKLLLNLGVKGFNKLIINLLNSGEKLCWAIRSFLESLQQVLKIYSWSLSENQASIQLRCKLTRLYLQQSLFKRHDFLICVHKLYFGYQNPLFWHLKLFSDYKCNPNTQVKEEENINKSKTAHIYGGGKALIFSSDELLPYASTDLHHQQYQFIRCIKKDCNQNPVLNENEIFFNVPLIVLAPKLTLKCAKNISILHDMFMPSKILLKNAQILLQDHNCQCGEFFSIFKPYKVATNAEYQQVWYQKHKEERAEYNKQPQYKESHKKSSQKHYWSKKDVKFPPNPPSAELCQNIVSDFCADTSPEVFEETGCAVCGKLTQICEMEDFSEVENVNLLNVDGVTRKARSKSSDLVKELRGPILAPNCSGVCHICIASLEKKSCQLWLLQMAFGLEKFQMNCKS